MCVGVALSNLFSLLNSHYPTCSTQETKRIYYRSSVSLLQLLLGYLPASRDLWEKELGENRSKYARLKEELLLSPVR